METSSHLRAGSQPRPSPDGLEAAPTSKPGPDELCAPLAESSRLGTCGRSSSMAAALRWGRRSLQEVPGEHLPRPGSVLVLGRLVTGVVSQSRGATGAATASSSRVGIGERFCICGFQGRGLSSLAEPPGQPGLVGQGL